MSAPVHVVVPVRDQLAYTRGLLDCLALQTLAPVRVHVLDNGSSSGSRRGLEKLTGEPYGFPVRVEEAGGLTIYECWNRGFWAARRAHSDARVLIVNNDILLAPHALEAMSAALKADAERVAAYPDYSVPWDDTPRSVPPVPSCKETRGVWGSDGMSGWCFMLAAERVTWRPLVDDLSYEWWYGDNHLARSIEEHGGRQVRVLGLSQWHAGSATARHLDLNEATHRDRDRWRASEKLRELTPTPRAPGRNPGPRVVRRQFRGQPGKFT